MNAVAPNLSEKVGYCLYNKNHARLRNFRKFSKNSFNNSFNKISRSITSSKIKNSAPLTNPFISNPFKKFDTFILHPVLSSFIQFNPPHTARSDFPTFLDMIVFAIVMKSVMIEQGTWILNGRPPFHVSSSHIPKYVRLTGLEIIPGWKIGSEKVICSTQLIKKRVNLTKYIGRLLYNQQHKNLLSLTYHHTRLVLFTEAAAFIFHFEERKQ